MVQVDPVPRPGASRDPVRNDVNDLSYLPRLDVKNFKNRLYDSMIDEIWYVTWCCNIWKSVESWGTRGDDDGRWLSVIAPASHLRSCPGTKSPRSTQQHVYTVTYYSQLTYSLYSPGKKKKKKTRHFIC